MTRSLHALTHWWLRLFTVSFPTVIIIDLLVVRLPAWTVLSPFVLLLALLLPAPRTTRNHPLEVTPPVEGRWVAINSPGSTVPSHGTHSLGQAFAIDITHPTSAPAPARLGWGLRQRRPEDYPGFGDRVLAVADGTVVSASDGQRDHRARSTWPGLLYFLVVEASSRELGGPRLVLGNHVVVKHPDGTYSLYAHLRRGSVQVSRGQAVRTGEPLGAVGNTGNSSEPHLHFQLMDRARPEHAAGLPFRWTGVEVELEPDPRWSASGSRADSPSRIPDLPGNGEVFTTSGRPAAGEPTA